MTDPHYELPRLAAIYDTASPWSPDRTFYLSLPTGPDQHILDLGCGTGLICDAYAANGHHVTGADPTPAMLAVARAKPNGKKITWVEATAETFRFDQRFDLIIMTGHAFQVLLTDDQVAAALATMRTHLKPTGRAVFESRNPGYDWPAVWNTTRTIDPPAGTGETGPIVRTSRVTSVDGEFLSFEQAYAFPDETLVSPSTLRFMPRDALERHLTAAGLQATAIYGDWDKTPFDESVSKEIIVTAQPA